MEDSRRAAYGYDQRFEVLGPGGMLAAGNHRPTEVSAHLPAGISVDLPEHFFLEPCEQRTKQFLSKIL